MIGSKRNRLRIASNCFIEPALSAQHITQVDVGIGTTGLEAKRLSKTRLRLEKHALSAQKSAKSFVSIRIVRAELQSSAIVRCRFLEFALLLPYVAQIELRLEKMRLQP